MKSGTISEKKHASEITKLEKGLEAEKKRIAIAEAKRTRAIRTFETIINTAAAVIGFLANPSGYAGLALAAGAAVMGGIQLATINNASMPAYGDGGRINHPHVALVGEKGSELMLSNKTITGKYGHIAEDLARVQEGKRPKFLDKPVNPNFGGMQKTIGRSAVSTVNNTVINQVDSDGMKKVEEKITLMSESILEMNASIKELKYLKAIISNDQMTEHEDEEELRYKYSGF